MMHLKSWIVKGDNKEMSELFLATRHVDLLLPAVGNKNIYDSDEEAGPTKERAGAAVIDV